VIGVDVPGQLMHERRVGGAAHGIGGEVVGVTGEIHRERAHRTTSSRGKLPGCERGHR
jgi:hypothetical protein